MLPLLLTLLLTAHLLAVAVASVGPLLCLWLDRAARRRGDSAARLLGQRIAWHSLTCLFFGGVFGLGAAGLMWLDSGGERNLFLSGISRLPKTRIYFGLLEFGFSVVCQGIVAATWNRWQRGRGWHRLIGFLGATNLLYHFPLLFAISSVLSTGTAASTSVGEPIANAEFRRLLIDPLVLAKATHHILASISIGGVFLLSLAYRLRGREPHEGSLGAWMRRGAGLGVVFAGLQLPSGLWLLFQLPPGQREALLGGDLVGIGLLGAGLFAALGLLHHLTATALGDESRAGVVRATVLLAVVVLCMTGARQVARSRGGSGVLAPSSPASVRQPKTDHLAFPHRPAANRPKASHAA